jgi:Undecaprenyl-phosphate glucose phosphotransferase
MNLQVVGRRRDALAQHAPELQWSKDDASPRHPADNENHRIHDASTAAEDAAAEGSAPGASNADIRSWIVASMEFVAIIIASAFSAMVYGHFVHGAPEDVNGFLGIGTTAGLLYWGPGNAVGSKNPRGLSKLESRIRESLCAWGVACVLLLLIIFVLKAGDVLSRDAMLTFFATGLMAVMLVRGLLAPTIVQMIRRAAFARRGAVVITEMRDPSLPAVLASLRSAGYVSPITVLIDASGSSERWAEERRRVLDRVAAHAKTMGAGEMFLCASGIVHERLRSLTTGLSLIPRSLLYVPDESMSQALHGRHIGDVGEHVTIEIQREPLSRAEQIAKRIIDVTGASFLLIALLPAFALTALAIKMDSPGPILFRQARRGLGGRPFDILKFRTMHVTENGPEIRQARRNDIRVTRVGRLLRRTSLDELPQLINVVRGEMSLVGPRPHAVAHDEEFAKVVENYEIRQHVKPGMTGWAQIAGLRGETPSPAAMAKRIEADLWYARNASLWLDIQILLRTAIVLFVDRNVY